MIQTRQCGVPAGAQPLSPSLSLPAPPTTPFLKQGANLDWICLPQPPPSSSAKVYLARFCLKQIKMQSLQHWAFSVFWCQIQCNCCISFPCWTPCLQTACNGRSWECVVLGGGRGTEGVCQKALQGGKWTAEDRRKAGMFRVNWAFPLNSCCGKPDDLNPERTLSAVTWDFPLVKIRAPWQLSWGSQAAWACLECECNPNGSGQYGKSGTANLLCSDVWQSIFAWEF